MTLLRMQNRTPPIYCEESRDFQLFCRLYDTIVNGLLFDIDTITDLINTKDIRSSFLQLLQTKLGFFTPYSFNENTLRYVLSGFPHMVKYKGSLKSIEYAVNNFLKINNILSPVTVTYQKTPLLLQNGYTVPDHTIVVGISASLQEATILKEVFRYILPFGTGYYFYYYSTRSELTNILEADNAIILYVSDNINSVLRSGIPDDFETNPENYTDFMDAGFIKSEKSNNEIKGTNEMKRLIGGIDTINLITNTFGELGDLIFTSGTNNSFDAGNNLQFLGVHYGDDTLSQYITDNFSNTTLTSGRTIIVYNEKEYLYVSNDWQELKLLDNVKNFEDVESPTSYNIVYKDASTVYEDSNNPIDGANYDDPNKGYYIYNGSDWKPCTYPIYVIGQDATVYDAYDEPLEEE